MGLGPVLFGVVVGIDVRGSVLEGSPAENGVVADKGTDVSVGYAELDARVDEIGKPCDTARYRLACTVRGKSRRRRKEK